MAGKCAPEQVSATTMQIDQSNISIAIELLMRGLPSTSKEFWEQGLTRMQASHAHRVAGEDIGQLIYAKGEPVGIGLTAINHQPTGELKEAGRRVNFASWYFEPAHRFRLPFMLNKMLRDKKSVFTDLTPTPTVWPILTSLGFQPLNQGVNAVCIPVASVYHAKSHAVIDWEQTDTTRFPETLVNMFEEHQTYGCWPFVIETAETRVPILVKPCRIKGIPAAQIIYSPDNQILSEAIGSLCRKLARRGLLTLLIDIPEGAQQRLSPVSIPITTRRRRFIKNGEQTNRTDYTYSELVFFDF
jgi:hypothetical protein